MELPRRAAGDELLRPGELMDIRLRLRNVATKHDLATVIACAFEHRTRMLPFIYASTRMAPAGVRAVGSAMADSGFDKTRIVLQQWNKHFRPSHMRLDGRVPDMFLVSSMRIHGERGREMIEDACTIDPANRPLIIAGGPGVIYEPWDVFNADPSSPGGADVAVTGEEYVLLSLLEVLLAHRAEGESMRLAFARARDSGALDEVPGLVYGRGGRDGMAEELVDTGIQRLLADLDELPDPVLGFRLFETPSRKTTLASLPLPSDKVRKHSRVVGVVLTLGCKFSCPYCGIPAYNQRRYRAKSGARVADEMSRLHSELGVRYMFGADDNFFNDEKRTVEIVEALARTQIDGVPFRKKVRWGTEVTVHDTVRLKDHLRTVRRAGVRALWLGVEDMTATLVKKGQSVDTTREAFGLLAKHGISSIAMMMHHDSQPLYTRGRPYGLINQARLLRKAGAVDMQVLMIGPAPGSKIYEQTYESGMVIKSAGGREAALHMLDGNYIIASKHPKPWRKQLNIIAAYIYFYNPLRFLVALVRPKKGLYLMDAAVQAAGMVGLTVTIRRTLDWALRLRFGKIVRYSKAPDSLIPMRSVDGGPASHALPETPVLKGDYISSTTEPAAVDPAVG